MGGRSSTTGRYTQGGEGLWGKTKRILTGKKLRLGSSVVTGVRKRLLPCASLAVRFRGVKQKWRLGIFCNNSYGELMVLVGFAR